MRFFLILVFLLGSSSQIFAKTALESDKIEHFAYFAKDRDLLPTSPFLTVPKFKGAQIMYAWNELELSENIYDFSIIQEDIELLRLYGKKLFIQLQDATFVPDNKGVPNYILSHAKYNGGVQRQFDNGNPSGWVSRRWDPEVRKRFHALIKALGARFDGVIAGINLQETSIVLEEERTKPAGFTHEKYRDSIIANMDALKKYFPKSVKMQYANFMPGEWLPWEDKSYLRSIYHHARNIGISVGTPDLMPKRKGQQNHAYRFMREFRGEVFGVAVQDGNYFGETGNPDLLKGEIPNIVPDLYDFAKTDLKVRYIFWVIQEPYFSKQVIPFLKEQKSNP